jgi:hypothetical protein
VYRISSKSVDKWPRYSLRGFFNKAAAAILENGVGSLVMRILDSAGCFFVCVSIYIKIGSEMAEVQRCNGFISLSKLRWGKKLLLGAKTRILGEREALKTIRQ